MSVLAMMFVAGGLSWVNAKQDLSRQAERLKLLDDVRATTQAIHDSLRAPRASAPLDRVTRLRAMHAAILLEIKIQKDSGYLTDDRLRSVKPTEMSIEEKLRLAERAAVSNDGSGVAERERELFDLYFDLCRQTGINPFVMPEMAGKG